MGYEAEPDSMDLSTATNHFVLNAALYESTLLDSASAINTVAVAANPLRKSWLYAMSHLASLTRC